MEVLRENLDEAAESIEAVLTGASFLAFDLEMTGIDNFDPEFRLLRADTPEEVRV